ncbi:MAG: hypothetical protein QM783_15430 [Phycisphaerales bacterium]
MRKWTGVACVVLGIAAAAAWGLSRWRPVEHRGNGWFVHWECGELLVLLDGVTSETIDYSRNAEPPPRPAMAWTLDAKRELFAIGKGVNLGVFAYTRIESMGETIEIIACVAWPAPLALWCAGGWGLWPDVRRWRWRRLERCEECGFSLVGLSSGAACPECGVFGKPA